MMSQKEARLMAVKRAKEVIKQETQPSPYLLATKIAGRLLTRGSNNLNKV
jgi:hypothetical protein